MTLQEALIQRIYELLDQRGISLNKCAMLCGISQSTLNNIVSGRNRSATVSTVKKLCDGLDVTLSEFFDRPFFEELEQEVQ